MRRQVVEGEQKWVRQNNLERGARAEPILQQLRAATTDSF